MVGTVVLLLKPGKASGLRSADWWQATAAQGP
jgi:hypothetical protein